MQTAQLCESVELWNSPAVVRPGCGTAQGDSSVMIQHLLGNSMAMRLIWGEVALVLAELCSDLLGSGLVHCALLYAAVVPLKS